LTTLASRAVAAAAWDNRFELNVDLEISPADGARYRRPYVAVWLEDGDGVAVRTLALWFQQDSKGPRWLPDLKRWYRDEKERRVLNGGDLVKTVSSATRRPGSYSLVWNGRDDDGKAVSQGDYTLCIEAAREHGTYQIIKSPIKIGTTPFTKNLEGNVEIQSAKVAYRRK
ncbi:DUF2271 domain-containing protein, partial [bacterium]